MSGRVFGFELLRAQAVQRIDDWLDTKKEECPGDTPIERLFYCALVLSFSVECPCMLDGVFLVDDVNRENALSQRWAWHWLLVEPQVQLDGWRVDFLIRARTEGSVWTRGIGRQEGKPRWRELIVECDGHDFHERTKEQAAKDRSRDREMAARGYDVFRFTGSELWRDPLGCADQVLDWADRGIG